MAQDTKQGAGKAAERPAAGSVDREPKDEPTPQGHGLPVEDEDEPKGRPTSERFQTEQAHPKSDKDNNGR